MPEKKTHPNGPEAFSFGAIQDKRPCVLLGVSGGIAAYKVVDLASKLTALGSAVKTVMTESACQFVGAKSFEALTHSAVFTSLWSSPEEHKSTHTTLVDWADIVVVAPATANILGKAANGICDDLLSTTLCAASHKPILLAPSMNRNMWAGTAIQRNMKMLREAGFKTVGPFEGRLADGSVGTGRMAEPREILAAIDEMLQK